LNSSGSVGSSAKARSYVTSALVLMAHALQCLASSETPGVRVVAIGRRERELRGTARSRCAPGPDRAPQRCVGFPARDGGIDVFAKLLELGDRGHAGVETGKRIQALLRLRAAPCGKTSFMSSPYQRRVMLNLA